MTSDRFSEIHHVIEHGRYFTYGDKKVIYCYGGKYRDITLYGDLP